MVVNEINVLKENQNGKISKINLERVNGGNNFLLNALKIIPVPILFGPRKK